MLDRSHYVMLHRNLTYTAVTRAKEFLVLVGDESAIRRAIQRQVLGQRQTGLMSRCRNKKTLITSATINQSHPISSQSLRFWRTGRWTERPESL